jgi:hypothetical protein
MSQRVLIATRLARLVVLATLCSFTLPTLSATPTLAADDWRGGVVVGDGSATYEPRVAYDHEGFAHVVFFTGRTQSEWDIYYTNNRAGAWSQLRQISDNDKAQQRNPDIAIGSNGHIHVIYQKHTTTNQIWSVASPDFGATWGTPVNLSGTPGRAYEPAITADASGGAHGVWIDSRWSGNLTATYAYKPAGGAWGAPVKVGSGGDFEKDPDIVTTGRDANVTVQIVYQARRTGSNSTSDFDVWRVTGAGGAFGKPSNFTRDSKWSLTPTITSDGNNGLFLAWGTDGNYHDVVFSYSNNGGASWSPAQNLYSRSTPGITPSLGYGLLNGTPKVHLAWSEGDTGKRIVLYLNYDPQTNRFSSEVEKASGSGTLGSSVAGSPVTNEVSVTYRDKSLRSVVSSRGIGAFIGAGIELDPGSEATRATELNVTLRDPQGDPREMRYSFDVAPDGEPWQPLQSAFRVPVPTGNACVRAFNIQFRTADGRVSPAYSRPLQIDNAVQAEVTLQGSATPLANPFHTTSSTAYLNIAERDECAGLRRFSWSDTSLLDLSNQGFTGDLPLTGGEREGPHAASVRVEDALGNQLVVSRTITVDRTPPQLISGTLSIPAPQSGLPSVLATLVLSDVAVRDNLYPNGYWGALIANRPLSATTDLPLNWQPIRLQGGETVSIPKWDVLDGISEDVNDRSMAGQSIEVLLKFIDGAGNQSSNTLTTTVTLDPDYRPIETRLPATLTN